MNLPKKIRVGPFDFDVIHEELEEKFGETNTTKLEIKISPSQCEAETLLHELLHAVWFVTGLDAAYSSKEQEKIVSALSPTLLDAILRNKELKDYMFKC